MAVLSSIRQNCSCQVNLSIYLSLVQRGIEKGGPLRGRMLTPSSNNNSKCLIRNGWSELYDLWNEFNKRVKEIRAKYVRRNQEDGTLESDPALLEGINQVEVNCRYTFQMLVMSSYFEANFTCFGVDSCFFIGYRL